MDQKKENKDEKKGENKVTLIQETKHKETNKEVMPRPHRALYMLCLIFWCFSPLKKVTKDVKDSIPDEEEEEPSFYDKYDMETLNAQKEGTYLENVTVVIKKPKKPFVLADL